LHFVLVALHIMPGDFVNEKSFSERLYAFMEGKQDPYCLFQPINPVQTGRGTPISKIPVFDHKELVYDLVY
jgi:hypothetical protein